MPRLRIGIDRPSSRGQEADYVLNRFTSSQLKTIQDSMDDMINVLFKHIQQKTGVDIIDEAIKQGTTR